MQSSTEARELKEEEEGTEGLDWSLIGSTIRDAKRFYRLYAVLLAVAFCMAVFAYAFGSPEYTAVAIVGPANPSPTATMLANITGTSAAAGLASKVLGGDDTGGGDPYQQYLQLLPSTRLDQVLIKRDHILQTIFYGQWDDQSRRWRNSWRHSLGIAVKRFLNRPVTDGPGVDELANFFDSNLKIVGVESGMSSALMPGTAIFTNISFKYSDPYQAEAILATILREADQIVREDQRRDVVSRISYLNRQLLRETNADERTALISILSDQEQLLTMIEADNRYASNLVVSPYASLIPTSPPPLPKLFLLAFAFSTIAWVLLVYLQARSVRVSRVIGWTKSKSKVSLGEGGVRFSSAEVTSLQA